MAYVQETAQQRYDRLEALCELVLERTDWLVDGTYHGDGFVRNTRNYFAELNGHYAQAFSDDPGLNNLSKRLEQVYSLIHEKDRKEQERGFTKFDLAAISSQIVRDYENRFKRGDSYELILPN
jgi:hypothetical protein